MNTLDRLKAFVGQRGGLARVAERTGFARNAIRKIATGETVNPGIKTVAAIEQALNALGAPEAPAVPVEERVVVRDGDPGPSIDAMLQSDLDASGCGAPASSAAGVGAHNPTAPVAPVGRRAGELPGGQCEAGAGDAAPVSGGAREERDVRAATGEEREARGVGDATPKGGTGLTGLTGLTGATSRSSRSHLPAKEASPSPAPVAGGEAPRSPRGASRSPRGASRSHLPAKGASPAPAVGGEAPHPPRGASQTPSRKARKGGRS